MATNYVQLPEGLKGCLQRIVDGVLDGSLSPRQNYGLLQYRTYLYSNYADAVRDFLNQEVQQRTRQSKSVVHADRSLLVQVRGDLAFALVPTGQGDESPEATYFEIDSAPNAIGFLERTSNAEVAVARRREQAYNRRVQLEAQGKLLTQEYLATMRRRVRVLLTSVPLTARQREDINAIAGAGFYSLDEQIDKLPLEKLYTLLVVLGQTTVFGENA